MSRRSILLASLLAVGLLILTSVFFQHYLDKQISVWLTQKVAPISHIQGKQLAWRFWDEKKVVGECVSDSALRLDSGSWVLSGRPHGKMLQGKKWVSWSAKSVVIDQEVSSLKMENVIYRDGDYELRARESTYNVLSQMGEFSFVNIKGKPFEASSSKAKLNNREIVLTGVHDAHDRNQKIRANELRVDLKTGQWRAIGQVQSNIDL